jgi:hypothetical protein
MADQRISVRDRVLAIDALERMSGELNLIAGWLGEQGAGVEADMAQAAAHSALAACWWLSRPLRQPPPPERWPGTGSPVPCQQPADQQQRA